MIDLSRTTSEDIYDAELAASLKTLVERSRAFSKATAQIAKATDNRDMKTLRASVATAAQRLAEVQRALEDSGARLDAFRLPEDDPAWVDAYAKALKRAVEAGGAPLQGEYPRHEAFPVEITIDLVQEQATINRKVVKVLDARKLAALIVREYKRVHGSSFNAAGFMRVLANAYDILRLKQQAEKTKPNPQVPIKDIHNLLTMRTGKADYSAVQFAFDIYRLRLQTDLVYDKRRFSFLHTREGGGIRVPTGPGKEEWIGNLELVPVAQAGD